MTETVKPGRRPPCQTCGSPGFYLCDYPVMRNGVGGSCGRVLCKGHATRIGGGVGHYCPPHDRASRLPAAPAKAAVSRECPHSWYDPGCKCGLPAPVRDDEAADR